MDTPQGAGDVTQGDQVQKMTYVLVRMLYQMDSELHRDSPTLSYGSHNVHCALGSPWNFYKIKYPIPRDSDLGGPRWDCLESVSLPGT